MQTTVLIIGNSIKLNRVFLDYIHEQISLHVKQINRVIYLDKNDKDMLFLLEKIINESKNTLIFAAQNSFNLIGKALCTITQDVLELKNSTLVPSKSKDFQTNSYLMLYNEKYINVIEACENKKLPNILLKRREDESYFSLIGIDEDSATILLAPIASTYEIKLTFTQIIDGWNFIEAKSLKYGDIDKFLKAVNSLFPDKFIQSENVLKYIVEKLKENKKTVSVAESCTGGLIASKITSIAGSSDVFSGSVVSYANNIKQAWLGVSKDTLDTYGAVSELCVREMMEGLLKISSADFAMATSGIAGPGGGSIEKPVGTVFVGARDKEGNVLVERLLLQGDRKYIQEQSTYHSIKLLLEVGKNIF